MMMPFELCDEEDHLTGRLPPPVPAKTKHSHSILPILLVFLFILIRVEPTKASFWKNQQQDNSASSLRKEVAGPLNDVVEVIGSNTHQGIKAIDSNVGASRMLKPPSAEPACLCDDDDDPRASSWKCGQLLFVCLNANLCPASLKSIDPEKEIIYLNDDECEYMQGVKIGEDCDVDDDLNPSPYPALSHKVCESTDGILSKYEEGKCELCQTTPAPTPLTTPFPSSSPSGSPSSSPSSSPSGSPSSSPSSSPSGSPSSSPSSSPSGSPSSSPSAPPTGCCDDPDTWKCGLDVYYCGADGKICKQSLQAAGVNLIINDLDCESMKNVLVIGEDTCPNGKELSHKVCAGTKEDEDSCEECDHLIPIESVTPAPTEAPTTPAPTKAPRPSPR
ncbi:hypothetical protein IV203_015835 [Nitzschia inconspicua]|uniref:Uncharacterized protein n=1 Tax=Nitzschia inconspicua TaxID=303405 RepID=A0A9K3PTT9_9STRA|nr:hypothetical protein IV203_015835 [Nitzschia inconspicua]